MKIQLPILGQVNVFKKAHRSQLQILKGNKELDIRFRKAHDQVFSEINCLECANCCRTTGPLFNQHDIDRIAKLLHLK
ncbi:MAG: hypothetical protein OEQ53_23205, partial [Saprospiraceae bacterium]|nr:hypothetical protein [Saprospiraceae bacterium]